MIEIYARCTTCGIDGAKIARIQRWAEDNGLMISVNKVGTSMNQAANKVHQDYLKKAGLFGNDAIIVEDTEEVTRLREWQIPS